MSAGRFRGRSADAAGATRISRCAFAKSFAQQCSHSFCRLGMRRARLNRAKETGLISMQTKELWTIMIICMHRRECFSWLSRRSHQTQSPFQYLCRIHSCLESWNRTVGRLSRSRQKKRRRCRARRRRQCCSTSGEWPSLAAQTVRSRNWRSCTTYQGKGRLLCHPQDSDECCWHCVRRVFN